MTKDEEHLRLLAVFHYVTAGMVALFSLIPLIHLTIGITILSGNMDPSGGEAVPEELGVLFVVMATVLILGGMCLATLIAFGGRSLQQRRRYTFCLVVAGFSCLFMPFGTVLGVFTIIVLMRESVRELWNRQAGAPEVRA